MNTLLEKYNEYIKLKDCKAQYLLSNGSKIEIYFKTENFIHLIGLHKLIDIQIIQMYNDVNNKAVKSKYIINRIKADFFKRTGGGKDYTKLQGC